MTETSLKFLGVIQPCICFRQCNFIIGSNITIRVVASLIFRPLRFLGNFKSHPIFTPEISSSAHWPRLLYILINMRSSKMGVIIVKLEPGIFHLRDPTSIGQNPQGTIPNCCLLSQSFKFKTSYFPARPYSAATSSVIERLMTRLIDR